MTRSHGKLLPDFTRTISPTCNLISGHFGESQGQMWWNGLIPMGSSRTPSHGMLQKLPLLLQCTLPTSFPLTLTQI